MKLFNTKQKQIGQYILEFDREGFILKSSEGQVLIDASTLRSMNWLQIWFDRIGKTNLKVSFDRKELDEFKDGLGG